MANHLKDKNNNVLEQKHKNLKVLLFIFSLSLVYENLAVFYSRDELYQTMLDVNAVVYNTGEVLFVPPINVISSCPVDLRSFPFDEQTCIMKFGSWTFSSDQVRSNCFKICMFRKCIFIIMCMLRVASPPIECNYLNIGVYTGVRICILLKSHKEEKIP